MNLPMSGPMVQKKALEVARKIKYDSFKASRGWLDCFKQRHNIVFKSICGKLASTNVTDVNEWKSKIIKIVTGYNSQDIFNADKTGLFYQVLPDKSWFYKEQTCSSGEIALERLMVLLCASMGKT